MGQAGGQAGSEWLISAQLQEYLAAFRDNYSPVHVPIIAQHFSVIKATRGTALSFNPIAGHPPIDNPESSTTYFVTWSPTAGEREDGRHRVQVFLYRKDGWVCFSLDALCKWCWSTRVHRWLVETIVVLQCKWRAQAYLWARKNMAVTDFSSPSLEKRLIESDFYLRGEKKSYMSLSLKQMN